ncbi:hypothetical protein [Sphingomonas sp. UYP23]
MPLSIHAAYLQHQIDTQLELAGLAPCDAIRAMHEDLEKLHRARLVALVLAERLERARERRSPGVTRANPLSAIAAWSIGVAAPQHVTQPV